MSRGKNAQRPGELLGQAEYSSQDRAFAMQDLKSVMISEALSDFVVNLSRFSGDNANPLRKIEVSERVWKALMSEAANGNRSLNWVDDQKGILFFQVLGVKIIKAE